MNTPTNVIPSDAEIRVSDFPPPVADHPAFKVYKVHEHGFIRLIDAMPSPLLPGTADQAIVQAARVSYGAGTKSVNEDAGLIDYLVRHRHTTPLEMVELKFHARMPIFVSRQWIRHRTASVNEYSARYSVVKDHYYVPSIDSCKSQSGLNKQGSEGQIASPEEARRMITDLSDLAFKRYCELLSQKDYQATDKKFGDELEHSGLSRELARIVLPVNYYTEWYWKCDLHNLFHFLSLRADKHAQAEIRAYAEPMLEICEMIAPLATSSFRNHRMDGLSLSGDELRILRDVLDEISAFAGHHPWVIAEPHISNTGLSAGRKRELLTKLSRLGIEPPTQGT